jgi:hypothetical protein
LNPTNPAKHPNWNTQIAQLSGATIFHTANWANVLATSYNYKPQYFTAFQNGQIIGCIPCMDIRSPLTGRRGVCLPFTDECHPLCPRTDLFESLWEQAVAHGRQKGWKHIELRGSHAALHTATPCATFVVHKLDLEGGEKTLMNQFRDSTKRNIRKAEKNNVRVHQAQTLEAVHAFYHLNCRTRRTHGLPPQPFKFFKALHQHVIAPGHGFVLLATFNNQTIAAAIFLHFNRQLVYKYGASERAHQSLRANNSIIWNSIQWGLQNGIKQLSFGRTELEHTGLRQFKSGWGAREFPLHYYRYEPKMSRFTPAPAKLKTSYAMFQKMPLPLLKLTGRILYRHMA